VRILFLTDQHLDYVSDPLYIGLSRVLSNEHVVDYPYKACLHDSEAKPWYLTQRPGKRYNREEIVELLRNRYFDLACLSSFRRECLDECEELRGQAPFPPLVFVDGGDYASIRHDVVTRFPIHLYFKRDYVWKMGSSFRDFAGLACGFRGDRKLFARTYPLPISIVLEALPNLDHVEKEYDVSYRGRVSHPRRVKAAKILSEMEDLTFSGGVFACPEDRKYKLRHGTFRRLMTKLFDNVSASESDQQLKYSPEDYYREIKRSRLAIALRGGGLTAPPRYFEIVALGSMLLSDAPETLIPDDFVDRCHAVYCRPDLSNLEALVRYYLKEDAERELIASQGHAHLLKYHTCERRAEYFLDICGRAL